MKQKILQLILFTVLAVNVMAQQSITGRVFNARTAEPLAGVSVQVKGTTTGTTTDENGNYTIHAPNSKAVLTFSFTGYTPQDITLGSSSSHDVRLRSEE